MLKLDVISETPVDLDLLSGVRVTVRPITVAAMLLARAAAAEVLRAADDDATIAAGEAFTRALARHAIVSWDGVGDKDGTPVKPTPERIDQLMDHWPAFDAFDRLYVGPALTGFDEKNV
ncbi:hypothetical protein [Bosea minatitlanensis]|jgi:hypothetical protein|uniref:Uncharacterized protein n=1 Tax=Bosea minatitlanensis TaxID=128782 RepID=A0ABW0F9B2_9HYPH|nr:hypothetical protein [Bosea minatitlanensis]MCT4494492.1 hypothetical protein [Bosea minatitlanensis]